MGKHPPQRPPSSGIINTSNLSVKPDQAQRCFDDLEAALAEFSALADSLAEVDRAEAEPS